MSEPASTSRFAELFGELLGAQTAKELIERVWREASPEVRQQLADAVARSVLAKAAKGDASGFAFDRAVERIVNEEVKRVAAERGDLQQALREQVLSQFDERWKATIADIVNRSITVVLTDAAREFHSRMSRR